jgi:hypothetical protein
VAIPVALKLARKGVLRTWPLLTLAAAYLLVIVSDPVIWHFAHNMPSITWMRQPVPLLSSSLLLYAMLLALVGIGLGVSSRSITSDVPQC